MRTVHIKDQNRFWPFIFLGIGLYLVQRLVFHHAYSEEKNLKLWKSMDSETRKVIFQLRKIAEQGESTEDEDMADIDEDVEFEEGEKDIKLVGDPAMIRRFASMNGREQESKLLNDNVKKSVLMLGEFKSGANFVSQIINQRQDALYLFEPLSPFGTSCNKEKDVKTHVLYQLNRCKFPNQEENFAKRGNRI
ncbi:unnamed protein product, partial [Oikopleura dioica]